jgi:polygalacturonase
MVGGGTVRFSKGSYLTGRVELGSNVELWVGPNATIQGSPDAVHWTPYQYRGCVNTTKRDFGGPLLYGSGVTNFSIRGGGTIRSSGPVWWPLHHNVSRGTLLTLVRCHNGVVENLTFTMSAACNILPMFSSHIRFDQLRIINPWASPNTDGWDPWGSSNLSFTNSYVSTGDDCVAVKSGNAQQLPTFYSVGAEDCMASSNIHVENITCVQSHGLTIGSEMSGSVTSVIFRNITIGKAFAAVRIKSALGRGGHVANIIYDRIRANNTLSAIWIDMHYSDLTHQNYSKTACASTPSFTILLLPTLYWSYLLTAHACLCTQTLSSGTSV